MIAAKRTEARMARRIPEIAVIGLITLFVVDPARVMGVERASPVPDMAGSWSRLTFGFEDPPSGQGPIGRLRREANVGGNYHNPILTPAAAAVVKERSDMLISGKDYPTPSSHCTPMVSPFLFRVQEMQVLQKKDEVVFLFMQDHQIRRVKLNQPHPARITPSWYGDSVGHYEADTLVVDTIGVKVPEVAVLDTYGSPYSAALHVVERYRLIPYEEAKAAQMRNVREAGAVATEQAATIDENYKGKGLQVQFTVEDKNVFTKSWSAGATYRRAASWVENVCAENTHEYYSPTDTPVPQADKPDF
jgi:hypothetical protein